ncbi:amino acid/polyamine/organocation transporter, APC superfamily [Ekhidna lutea]|uniref:Arginine/agmatine antiporter n=1 Tax=Ekhidna lutea TaxID=447679 RepID=A0A239JEB3_EKHLU|nr:amino acid permease [Ekhidna lutea]SNT04149.1 amino acid/polyamine/organocation transporter, APC superfamily [Ekhidna lutea]
MSKQKLGLWTSTSLVVGNSIGAGIFLAPAVLATYGSISLIGWLISGFGAYFLAQVFIKFSKVVPGKSGGPYTYSRAGLGDFAGFQVAWGYWISIWATNATIAIALVGYLGVFFPILKESPIASVVLGLAIVWSLVWLNARGIREAGIFQLITTVLKILPLIAISLIGLFFIEWSNFKPFNTGIATNFEAIAACTAFTIFSYMGLESAAVPAEDIIEPDKTVRKATIIGLITVIVIYLISTSVLIGLLSVETLANSTAPFADAAKMLWGQTGEWLVAAGAVFSTLGALNGWILIQGQVPAVAAKDHLFPAAFKRTNKNNAPVGSLVLSTVLISLLMIMNYTKGLVEAFKFALLLASITALLAYLYTSVALIVKLHRDGVRGKPLLRQTILSGIAFVFAVGAVIGSGQEVVFWGFILILLGLPVYAFIKTSKNRVED